MFVSNELMVLRDVGVDVWELGEQGELVHPMTEFRNSLTELVTLVPLEPREDVSVPMRLTRDAVCRRRDDVGVPQIVEREERDDDSPL